MCILRNSSRQSTHALLEEGTRNAPLRRRQLASDHYSGICPKALHYLEEANAGHACSYGDDPWTAEACDLFRELFEVDCDVFFNMSPALLHALRERGWHFYAFIGMDGARIMCSWDTREEDVANFVCDLKDIISSTPGSLRE